MDDQNKTDAMSADRLSREALTQAVDSTVAVNTLIAISSLVAGVLVLIRVIELPRLLGACSIVGGAGMLRLVWILVRSRARLSLIRYVHGRGTFPETGPGDE
jgi:hypothetical protein